MARNPNKTRLDTDVTKPGTTAPGDAPYDTTDPDERATSVRAQPGQEALAEGRVNGVVPLPKRQQARHDSSKDRTETYEATGPDGNTVTVTRNVETGESAVKSGETTKQ